MICTSNAKIIISAKYRCSAYVLGTFSGWLPKFCVYKVAKGLCEKQVLQWYQIACYWMKDSPMTQSSYFAILGLYLLIIEPCGSLI